MRTIVVDDVEDIRALLSALMEKDGRFDVVGEGSNGQEAIDVVTEHRPDVVVLDLAMPVMDGLTALPAIREAAPDVRVVVLSGFPADQMGPSAYEAGAVGYLEKGRNIRSLAADIYELVGVLEAVTAVLLSDLPPEPRSAGRARAALTNALVDDDLVDEDALDTLVLLTSELVTNAVAHAGTGCHLAVELLPDVVRVSVSDHSPEGIHPRQVSDESESGRGLSLVASLSSKWGVIPRDHGKTVWFEVPRALA